jgi:hypothetical protein
LELSANPSTLLKGFKGPKARIEVVDNMIERTKPHEWNNIPVPIVDTTVMQLRCWAEFKQLHHGLHNNVIEQRNET